jgi:hypothetical protein
MGERDSDEKPPTEKSDEMKSPINFKEGPNDEALRSSPEPVDLFK